MKTITKLFTLTFFTLIFTIALQAATVNIIDTGAIPNDNIDDTVAIREAVEKLITSGGGTLIFPEGTTDIAGNIDFQTWGNTQSYRLMGDKGSFVRLNGNQNTEYFTFGNNNQVEFNSLIFFAAANPVINANKVIFSNFVKQTKISNCSFFGIGANTAII